MAIKGMFSQGGEEVGGMCCDWCHEKVPLANSIEESQSLSMGGILGRKSRISQGSEAWGSLAHPGVPGSIFKSSSSGAEERDP